MQFQVGKTYSTRSICDSECVYSFQILKRTEKCVWINRNGKPTRRTVRVDRDGVESIDPHGRYSMSPVLRAAPYK